jgi:hypothetical protein
MKTKTLVIGAVTLTAVLAGGWAVAQSVGPPSGFGPPFMHGRGSDEKSGHGPGMMNGMHHGMGPGMKGTTMEGMGGHGPGMMKGMGPGMMRGRPGGAFADPAQLDTLKGELGITAAQEGAWSKYAKTVQAAAAMMTARESIDPSAVAGMSPADRFAFATKMREQGQRQLDAVRTAANELLAALDDAQKAKAGNLLPGLAFGPGPMRHGAFATDQPRKH